MKAIASCAEAVTAARGAQIRQGQAKASKSGGSAGRTVELSAIQKKLVLELVDKGVAISSVAQSVAITRQSIYDCCNANESQLPLRKKPPVRLRRIM